MSTNVTRISRRRPPRLTGGIKATLAALGVITFVGGWNGIARLEQAKEAQASEPSPLPAPLVASNPTPTPWPAIPPLPEFPPIPTLAPTPAGQWVDATSPAGEQGTTLAGQNEPAFQVAALPTLAPWPALAPLPSMPAPPPPPPPPPSSSGGGGHRSGGS
jgi:hypothetical protein